MHKEEVMGIEASQWGTIVARVHNHAKDLHPGDAEKQQELMDHLLGISSEDAVIKAFQKRLASYNRKPSLFQRFLALF